jgi:hypothetical protein
MRARLGLVVLGVVLAATFAAAYQATPPGAASQAAHPPVSISGSVVDGVTGAPVAGADVVFNQLIQRGNALHGDGPSATGVTDSGGRFTITGTPTGRLRMRVTKVGYLEGHPDQLGPSDDYASGWFFLDVTSGEQVKDITVKMWRASTIAGVVEDEAHDPLVGESVLLLQRRHEPGGVTVGLGSASVRTDDRGRFRLAHVRPGEYYLLVSPPLPVAGRGAVATPPHQGAYFPGVLRLADASVVRVGGGETLDGINVTVGIGGARRARSVAGRLVGPADRIASVEVKLIDAAAPRELANYAAARVRSGPDGSFRFASVAPGQYRLLAQAQSVASRRLAAGLLSPATPMTDDPIFWADESVVVDDQDITDLPVPLKTGGRLRGRLVFEPGKPAPTSDELRATTVRFFSVDRSLAMSPVVPVDGNGSFATVALTPGLYSMMWTRPVMDGWYASMVPAFEVGASDLDVELRMLGRPTTLAGVVSDAQGRSVTQARVLAFPRDPTKWGGSQGRFLVRQIILNSKGRFSEPAYAGEYLVAAISSVPANWSAPEFLETLAPRATRATVVAGETLELSLRVQSAQ